MHLGRPHNALIPTLDGDVLVVLAGTTRPLTGRDVAKLARHGSQRAVASVLDRLSSQGLVDREQAGRAYLHSLNRRHLLAPLVEELAGVWTNLLDRVREALASWEVAPVHASLFGSAARRDGGVESDLDLFIVRPHGTDAEDDQWTSQLAALAEEVLAWTGNHASIVELGADEVPNLVRTAPPVLASLRSDGIDLFGVPLRQLLEIAT